MNIEKIVDSLENAGLLAPPVDGVDVKPQVVSHLRELLEKDSAKTQGESE